MLVQTNHTSIDYDQRLTTAQGSSSVPFQRWFKFKEAFSAEFVFRLINELPKKPDHILDCFGGSGTTGLVAKNLGIQSTLIEVNPFLADLIEAKLSPCTSTDLTINVERVMRKAQRTVVDLDALRLRLPPTFIAPGHKNRYIFNEEVASAIEALRYSISELKDWNSQKLLMIALGSCLIGASNVRIDGKGRRYRKGWEGRQASAASVFAQFMDNTTVMAIDLIQHSCSEAAPFNLLRGDTRERIKDVNQPIDFALFSPPYPNSFDYTDVYNVELWMLGYFKSSIDNTSLRQATLRSHVQCSRPAVIRTITSPLLDKTLKKLDQAKASLWDQRIPEMILGYFEDLVRITDIIGKKLTPGGRIAMVVGNSLYAGVLIDVPKILSEALVGVGLVTVSSQSVRSMRTSMQQRLTSDGLSESLIIFSAKT